MSDVGRTEPSSKRYPIAACPGCGILGGMGITAQGRYWHADCWGEHLERAITEHRTAITNAGTIKVQPGYELVAEAKQAADKRLWEALTNV